VECERHQGCCYRQDFDFRTSKPLRMKDIRMEEIVKHAAIMKAVNIRRIRKTWPGNLLERCEGSDGSLKGWGPLTTIIIRRCVNMIDAYKNMSLEEGHHQKVICNLFFGVWLLEKSGYVCRIKKRRLWRMSQLCTLWYREITVEEEWRQMSLWRKP